MRLKYLTVTLTLIMLVITAPVMAVETGGKVETKTISVFKGDSLETLFQEKINLELFLPENNTTSAKFEFDIITDSSSELNYSHIRKLYIEKRLNKFDLTIGRQPVSWMFGSLVNPVDFNLGAEAVEQETAAKNIDGVEFYYPINWGSNISAVLAAANDTDIKYGLRGRTTFSGYDLTINFVHEQNNLENRIATTIKGDLASIGAYGATGYYLEQEEEIFLVGIDYSFYYQDLHQIVLQGEYIHDQVGMSNYLGGIFANYSKLVDKNIGPDLIAVMGSYSLDDFSTVRLTSLVHPQDSSMLFIPEYKTQLLGNLDLNFRLGLLAGSNGEVFGPKIVSTNNNELVKSIVELTVSYPF